MILGVLHQLLKLKEIKPVSDPLDSIFGQKWPIFGPKTAHFWPKNCVFGRFGDNLRHFYIFLLSKMDDTLLTSSTFEAVRDKNRFGYFRLIFGPKMAHFYPKNGVFADFWMIKGISIPLLISKKNLSSSALQVDLICQVPYIADIKNCKNALNYPKISQKRSSWFQNGPFFAQK